MVIRKNTFSLFIGNLKGNEQRSTDPPKQFLIQNHECLGILDGEGVDGEGSAT